MTIVEDITFRRAAAADLPAVRTLLDRCRLPTADLQPAHLEQFFVARAGDRLAGVVGIEGLGTLGLLRSLAVAPDLRGRQLGRRLWEYACAEARRRGIQQLYLLTTTAEGLFAKWGFARVARDAVPDAVRATAEYATLCPSSAVVMRVDVAP
jgi:N-acetylglutamate synthase-like GNAT family acetyltransferase